MSHYKARSGPVAVKTPARVGTTGLVPHDVALDDLPESFAALYDEIVEALRHRGLTGYDLRMIRQFCSQIALAEAAEREVLETGPTVPTLAGGVQVNPAVRVQRDAVAAALRIASEYGLTLAGRLRLGIASAVGMSALDQIDAGLGIKRDVRGQILALSDEAIDAGLAAVRKRAGR